MSEKKPVKKTEPEVEPKAELTPEIEALIKARVEAEIEAAKPETEEQKRKEVDEWLNQRVTVKLMKDSERYKDDVFVGVNGKGWLIKRGVPVQIPRFVAMALEDSLAQDEQTAMLIEKKTADYQRKIENIS
jgi:hypothetical protein